MSSHAQMNPPFDRSAPCPACQQELRNISALIHNFLNRCDVPNAKVREGKAMVKLFDLRSTAIPTVPELTVWHPVTAELVRVARALVEATDGMTNENWTIRWTPEITAKVEVLILPAAIAEDAYTVLSDAHFEDSRHSSGQENVLRESRGSSFSGHFTRKADTSYNFTVDLVDHGGDLHHQACGARLQLHDHFKAKLASDPTFYGQVWCPKCRTNAPEWQFDRVTDQAQAA